MLIIQMEVHSINPTLRKHQFPVRLFTPKTEIHTEDLRHIPHKMQPGMEEGLISCSGSHPLSPAGIFHIITKSYSIIIIVVLLIQNIPIEFKTFTIPK